MKRFIQQLGQGMTEYIIIVALIAIAAIAAYGFFGDTLRSQVGGMAMELAGDSGDTAVNSAGTAAVKAEKQKGARDLSDYTKTQE